MSLTSKQRKILQELTKRKAHTKTMYEYMHDGQKQIYSDISLLPDSVRQVVIFCARQYGKSYLGIMMAIEKALSKPKSQVAILAPSKDHAKNIVVPKMKDIVANLPAGSRPNHLKSELRWKCPNGSEIILAGYETAVEACRGLTLDAIFLEESGLSRPDDYNYILKSVLLPTLTHSRGKIYHLTTPSKLPDHPLHTQTIPKAKLDKSFFCYTIWDNPLLSDERKLEIVEDVGGIDSIDFQREYLCNVVRDTETMVIPNFDITRHSIPDIQLNDSPDRKYIVSVDFGGVRDKTVALLLTGHLGKLAVIGESISEPGTSTDLIIKDVRDMLNNYGVQEINCHIFADAPGQLLLDLNHNYSFPAVLPNKYDWMSSIKSLDASFRREQIVILTDRCPLLTKTIMNGEFNKNKTDFSRSKELGHCDAIAALMYGHRMKDILELHYSTPPIPYTDEYYQEEARQMKQHTEDSILKAKQLEEDSFGFEFAGYDDLDDW